MARTAIACAMAVRSATSDRRFSACWDSSGPPRWTGAICGSRDRSPPALSRSNRVKVFSFAALALLVAFPLRAQVGHDPESSPYRDLEYRQEFTPYGGYARARVDAAGVTPQSAAIAGLRYEL